MSAKKTRPVVGKLITFGRRSAVSEAGTSPTTPLEFKVLSPRGIINCDMGGVGLGIVAALEKSGDSFPANPVRCDPILVHPVTGDLVIENETGSLEEEYTIVTCHKPNESYTKVYHGGCGFQGPINPIKINGPKNCIFNISPVRFGDEKQTSDFLIWCHLCRRKLHGRDIYMYRGEKAFCSEECRYRQIGMDETREKHCSSEASVDVSNSPCCNNGQMLSTGIFAI